jgi:alkylmercury lyase
MSSNDVQPRPIGGMDWWDMQRQQLAGTSQGSLFFKVAPHAYRLLAEGQPVTLDRLATAASVPLQDVETALRGQSGTDWDNQGRLVGFGLTLRPTPHRFTFSGRTVFAWCASDALMIPVITGRSGTVESPCPATGQQITVEVTPERVRKVDPPSAVVSLVRPDRIDDVRTDVCVLGSFFASSEAAGEWLAAHPEGMIHSVEDDFELHREVMEKIGWAYSRSPVR